MIDFDWRDIRLAVFDVDGTLYDQRCIRPRMIRQLVTHCLRHPGDLKVLRLISEFRRCREKLAEAEIAGIAELQYRCPAETLGLATAEVRRVVESWMLQRPLPHLRGCRFDGVGRCFAALERSGVMLAVLSDYPAAAKLVALGLEVELQVSGVDPQVDRLKPHPRGLQRVLELAGVAPEQAVMIGDREDRDGECARRAGVRALIKVSKPQRDKACFRDFADLTQSLEQSSAEDAALQ
jgi:FMN phosphatase YigB (HAD superfamily)